MRLRQLAWVLGLSSLPGTYRHKIHLKCWGTCWKPLDDFRGQVCCLNLPGTGQINPQTLQPDLAEEPKAVTESQVFLRTWPVAGGTCWQSVGTNKTKLKPHLLQLEGARCAQPLSQVPLWRRWLETHVLFRLQWQSEPRAVLSTFPLETWESHHRQILTEVPRSALRWGQSLPCRSLKLAPNDTQKPLTKSPQ